MVYRDLWWRDVLCNETSTHRLGNNYRCDISGMDSPWTLSFCAKIFIKQINPYDNYCLINIGNKKSQLNIKKQAASLISRVSLLFSVLIYSDSKPLLLLWILMVSSLDWVKNTSVYRDLILLFVWFDRFFLFVMLKSENIYVMYAKCSNFAV